MISSEKTPHKHKKYRKGDSIVSLKPWKVVPLFLDDAAQMILAKLPGFVQDYHAPLVNITNNSVMILPGLSRLLKKAHHAGADILCIYTLVTAITLVLQDTKLEDLYLLQSVAHEEDNGNSDDSEEMRLEAWTWIQDRVDWHTFQRMYARIQNALCIAAVSHPLEVYATQVVPGLTRDDVQIVVNMLGLQAKFSPSLIVDSNRHPTNSPKAERCGTTVPLRLCQLLKDAHAPRSYGILFRAEPSTHADSSLSTATTMTLARATQNEFVVEHACLPNAALDVASPTRVDCIALYDTDMGDNNTIKICSVPLDAGVMRREARRRCGKSNTNASDNAHPDCCILCHHDNIKPSCGRKLVESNFLFSLDETVQLGHYYFQQELYHDAYECYTKALKSNDSLDDIRHALGALQLAQGQFLKAQQTWKKASKTMKELGRSPNQHTGIHLQLQKQQAYRYFETPVTPTEAVSGKYKCKSYFNNECFVTPMLEEELCQKLIQIATSNGRWTTGRHYAVPTNDIPIHEVPELLAWFSPWMEHELDPLIKSQFHIANPGRDNPRHQRFYVHDAFFVRYIGGNKTNHLPCHLDECTHSFVICLNDDFQGGGTYFHDHNTVLSPKVGEVITFKGDSLKHGGDAVTSGTRYILAGFLYLDKCYSAPVSKGTPQSEKVNRQMQTIFQERKKQKTCFSFGFEV